MAGSRFSIGDAISYGWEVMKEKFWFFAGLLVVTGIISWIPNIIVKSMGEEVTAASIIITILGMIINMFISLGLLKIVLNIFDQKEAKISDLFSCPQLIGRMILASILCGLAVMGGYILLIIPGIILGIRLQFFAYLIVDKNMAAMEALKKSFEMTKGATWDIFLFNVLGMFIGLAGLLCLVVGLFAAMPVIYMAQVYVYRKLLSDDEMILDVGGASEITTESVE